MLREPGVNCTPVSASALCILIFSMTACFVAPEKYLRLPSALTCPHRYLPYLRTCPSPRERLPLPPSFAMPSPFIGNFCGMRTPLQGKGCEKGVKLASPTDPKRPLCDHKALRCNVFCESFAGCSNPEPTD